MKNNQWRPSKAWWSAYGALVGNEEVKPIKERAKPKQVERQEQMKFNAWFDKYLWNQGFRWFHPANGGSRGNIIEGANFKRMGVKAGILDIVCPMARKAYHGLIIELKRPNGRVGDVDEMQIGWLDWFSDQNWSTHVAFGFEEARDIVKDYFTPTVSFEDFKTRKTTWQVLKQR